MRFEEVQDALTGFTHKACAEITTKNYLLGRETAENDNDFDSQHSLVSLRFLVFPNLRSLLVYTSSNDSDCRNPA